MIEESPVKGLQTDVKIRYSKASVEETVAGVKETEGNKKKQDETAVERRQPQTERDRRKQKETGGDRNSNWIARSKQAIGQN